MQSARKTAETKIRAKKSTKDDLTNAAELDERVKKNVYSVSTPRNYAPKSSTADIYARKKPTSSTRKVSSTPRTNESPMKNFLRSSPSTVSQNQISSKSSKPKLADSKTTQSDRMKNSAVKNTPRKSISNVTVNSPVVKRRLDLEMDKDSPVKNGNKREARSTRISNVTVNSPVVKKRLNLDMDKDSPVKNGSMKEVASSSKHPPQDVLPGRQRTKTRTLEDDEVKILTPEAMDNNAAMQDLSHKLTAQPKAFYVDLEEKPKEAKETKHNLSGEDEVSYEDDFESYESDFDSYHSEARSDKISTRSDENSGESDDQMRKLDECDESEDFNHKEVKDEEKMLDSGNFDLRDPQRSASRKPAAMAFILEGTEDVADDKKVSLTDEGFQEMSSSSAVSSMKMVHTDVIERPLFIDFTKSKENKRKRKILEKLQQRAKDILSMVTLHEMSYSLFEMKPIPYDLYMATFGRKNYTQTAVQTFEDGNNQEIQTDDVLFENKWSQFPVEFSTSDIITEHNIIRKYDVKNKDLTCAFDYLINKDIDNTTLNVNEEYKRNPLKIFLEQKEGTGNDKMLPEEIYKVKLKNNDFNVNKLRKFLKKCERKLSSILSVNAGSIDTLNYVKKSKIPFSTGFLSIAPENITEDKLGFLNNSITTGVCISDTKENLILTYHKRPSNSDATGYCFVCLWDTSVVRCEPLKVLKATDNVRIGRHRGNTNGVFAAALEDRTIHVWDLSEEPTWCKDAVGETSKLVEVDTRHMTNVEIDREWNLRNSQVGYDEKTRSMMQVSAYTSSAINMISKDSVDVIVALEFIGDKRETSHNSGRKIVGQICTLQRIGILRIWLIIQEKTNTHDFGKAYWSKIKLEKNHTIYLSELVDASINIDDNFNLNAAKRRLASRKQERAERRKDLTRPRSAILKNYDRPSSVASPRKNLPISRNVSSWDSEIVCNHLKVLRLNKTDHYLVATGNGEVLCCKRNLRDFKVDRFSVASDKQSITRLEVSYSNLPYFLAATDSGTINLCSVLDARVLLTLDCRNGPPVTTERCLSDHKGRFVASVPDQMPTEMGAMAKYNDDWCIRHLWWSPSNPFTLAAVCTRAVVGWQLTHSDMHARSVADCSVREAASTRFSSLALLTEEGEVQIHRLSSDDDNESNVVLFKKYVTLL